MKTLELPDEIYDALISMANEYVSQDNRATAMPYLFQIQDTEKVYDTGMNGSVQILYDEDHNEYESINDLKRDYEHVPYEADSISDLITFHDEWIDENKLTPCSYTTKYIYKNGFLTESACKDHIRLNHYHYTDPADYLAHAWRNRDMELISKFLVAISDNPEGFKK